MWAMMPMFLIFSIGTVRAITKPYVAKTTTALPAVMRESLVRFRHAVNVILLLDRSATHVGGVGQLICQLVGHSLLRPAAGVLQNPTDRQADPAVLGNLDGHLIVGTAHAPCLHFEQRLGVLHRLFEKLQR